MFKAIMLDVLVSAYNIVRLIFHNIQFGIEYLYHKIYGLEDVKHTQPKLKPVDKTGKAMGNHVIKKMLKKDNDDENKEMRSDLMRMHNKNGTSSGRGHGETESYSPYSHAEGYSQRQSKAKSLDELDEMIKKLESLLNN